MNKLETKMLDYLDFRQVEFFLSIFVAARDATNVIHMRADGVSAIPVSDRHPEFWQATPSSVVHFLATSRDHA